MHQPWQLACIIRFDEQVQVIGNQSTIRISYRRYEEGRPTIMSGSNQKIKALIKQAPLEIITLFSSIIFTCQFERNLDISQIQAGAVKTFIETADKFLVHFTAIDQPLGALLYGCSIALVIQHYQKKTHEWALTSLQDF